jgi:WD domain, G-beta repeat
MMRILILLLLTGTSFAQNCPNYDDALKKGDQLFGNKKYDAAIKAYQEAQIAAHECDISTTAPSQRIDKVKKAQDKKAIDDQNEIKKNADLARAKEHELQIEKKKEDSTNTKLGSVTKANDTLNADKKRTKLLTICGNVADASVQAKDDPQLAGLLAVEAFRIDSENKGGMRYTNVYTALHQSLKKLDPSYPADIVDNKAETKAMAISADGKLVALLSDGNLCTYSGEQHTNADKKKLDDGSAGTCFMSPDGKFIITNYDDHTLKIWNVSSGESSPGLKGHTGEVLAAAFGKDGQTFITGGKDSLAIVWKGSQPLKQLKFPARIRAIALNAPENEAFVGCDDGKVYKWAVNGDEKKEVIACKGSIKNIIFSGDEKHMIVSDSKGELSVIAPDGKPRTVFEKNSIDHIAVNDKNGLLLAVTSDHLIHIYNLKNLEQYYEINDLVYPTSMAHPIILEGIAFAGDGDIYVAWSNNTARTENVIRRYYAHARQIKYQLMSKLTRDLTTDEWNSNIGTEVPYERTITSK